MKEDLGKYERDKAIGALAKAKRFVRQQSNGKTLYTVTIKGCTYTSTNRADVDRFMQRYAPELWQTPKEIKHIDLAEADRLRKKLPLGEVIKKMKLKLSVGELRKMLINGGYLIPVKERRNANASRNQKIQELSRQGYTPKKIKDTLGLTLQESTIDRIAHGWD